ncbi:MAG: LytTR family transcriptional regulator DNA-binding domain-containing protein, partial [Bacteroidota bacterium]
KGKTMTLENMSLLAKKLPKDQFTRVHRSVIVAVAKIDFLEQNRVVIGEKYIPISRTYHSGFWKLIGEK